MAACLQGGYALGALGLSNSGQTIALFDTGNNLIDQVVYGVATSGKSLYLDPDAFNAVDNDNAANWGVSTTTYGLGDFGTPGAANPQLLSVIHPLDLL